MRYVGVSRLAEPVAASRWASRAECHICAVPPEAPFPLQGEGRVQGAEGAVTVVLSDFPRVGPGCCTSRGGHLRGRPAQTSPFTAFCSAVCAIFVAAYSLQELKGARDLEDAARFPLPRSWLDSSPHYSGSMTPLCEIPI